ncbi:immunity 49 family protein [Nocardiopsis alba]|uniref:immunity 49 family protein n=1 Tax=Nocardiopsis alba TaxID=53437 RepID=UPI00366E02FF
MYVERPEVVYGVDEEDLSLISYYTKSGVESLGAGVGGMHHLIGSFSKMSLELLVVDPGVVERRTWEAWVLAMQYQRAFFRVSMAESGSRVDCMVDHRVWNLSSRPLISAFNASSWAGALFRAWTCRDFDYARFLADVPVEVLRRAGESQGTRFMRDAYAWVEVLQAFVKGDPRAGVLLEEARELADPGRASFAAGYAGLMAVPQMEVLGRLIARDGDGFNEALVRALESYREYTAADLAKGGLSGIVPLELLGMACLVRDGRVEGVSLEVESDYFPEGILDGRWLDAFPI